MCKGRREMQRICTNISIAQINNTTRLKSQYISLVKTLNQYLQKKLTSKLGTKFSL